MPADALPPIDQTLAGAAGGTLFRAAGGFRVGSSNGRGTRVHEDGDWSVAVASGPACPEWPFEDEGDAVSTILRQPFQQRLSSFTKLAAGAPLPGRPDFYLVQETAPRHLGGGMVEWERVYAQVPRARSVPEDFVFNLQYVSGLIDESAKITLESLPVSLTSHLIHEYFRWPDRAGFPPLQKAELVIFDSTLALQRGAGNLQFSSTLGLVVTNLPWIVAEDSKIRRWMGPIFARVTRVVPGPTMATFGSAFSLPPRNHP